MQGACDQFLAGARLTLDQHIGVGGRDLANFAVEILHGRAAADDTDLAIGAVVCAFFRRTIAFAVDALGRGRRRRLPVTQDAGDGLEHFIMVERLGDVVHRSHLHGIDR
ncbi:hypothetical protein D9M71_707560 [compost metagenome]